MVIKNAHIPGLGTRDIRVADGAIAAIESTLDGPADIEATSLVAIPGFVDTHRHVVQAPLRGIGPDMALEYYLTNVLGAIGERFTEEDTEAAIMLGAVEALDAGVTTVFDWARTAAGPTIETYQRTGLRAVVAHDPGNEPDLRKYAGLTGLVTTAAAPLGVDYVSLEDTKRNLELARELGLVTSLHIGGRRGGGVAALHEAGLLRPDLHFVHGNKLSDDELRMIVDSGGSLTVSTVIESLMGHGPTMYGRFRAVGGSPALGVDVVVNNRPEMFSEMQSTLWSERVKAPFPARDLLRSATIDGARAVGLAEVGELKVGYRADIVLLDGLEHLLGGQADIAGAVVTSLGVENVRTVLVDGEIVKRDGTLVDHDLSELRAATRELAAKVLA